MIYIPEVKMKTFLYVLIPIIFIASYYVLGNQEHNKKTDSHSANSEINPKLGEILKKIDQFKLDVIKITPQVKPVKFRWQSKFGGDPYWPIDIPYPKNHSGEPLHLLAQINFSEVPELEGYPKSGLLQFFINAGDSFGLEFLENGKTVEKIITNPNGYRVIFHKNITHDRALLRNEFPSIKENEYLPLTNEYSLVFSKESERVSPFDYRFETIIKSIGNLSDNEIDLLYETLNSIGSKIGGYANFAQTDPRSYIENDEWILLFQMDSYYDDGIEIMWGDSGIANFFIRPNDLKNLNFSKVWYNWDCF